MDSKIVHGPTLIFAKALEETTLDEYLIKMAEQRFNDVFLIDALSNQKLMTKEFLLKSYSLAAELQAGGCNKNTIVGIVAENRLEYPIALLGTILTGATFTCFNPAYTADELKSIFNIAKPTIMFCSRENRAKVEQIVPPSNLTIVFDPNESLSDLSSNEVKFSQLVHSGKTYTRVKKSPDDMVLILYSSGTTGLPKGVTLTQKNVVYQLFCGSRSTAGSALEEDKADMTKVSVAPMFHAIGLFNLLTAIVENKTLVIMSTFDERLYLSTIEKYKIRQLSLVPTLLHYLLKSGLVNEYDLSSVESVTCGSAPLMNETEKAFQQKFHLKDIKQGYGLTECTLGAIIKRDQCVKVGTCGSPLPGTQVKVVHKRTGKTLGKNQTGELRLKGPHIMKGYYGNEKATAEAFDEDGWLRTGDIGYYDEDGDFFIVDRAKELIKYKGYQVAPAELEALLLTHPAVADCGVVGVPDSTAGELPRAYVVKRAGAEVTEKEITQYVAARKSPQKRLRGGVEFVTEIPKSATGKILRRKLRDMWIAKSVLSKL